jgi:hypothetical protein
MLLSFLGLWYLVLVGFPSCLGVNGPKFGPNFSVVASTQQP